MKGDPRMLRRLAILALGLVIGLGIFGPPAHGSEMRQLRVSWAEPARSLITDPAYAGSWAWVDVADPRPGASAPDIITSWTLTDSSGSTVLGPVSVPANARTYFTVGEGAYDETSHVRLPAGSYMLTVTERLITDPTTGAATTYQGTLPLTYVDDPPAQAVPAVTTVAPDVYWPDASDITPAHWRVPALSGQEVTRAQLLLTDTAGAIVDRETVDVSRCVPTTACDPADPATRWQGTQYDVIWTGYGMCSADGCPKLPYGTYTAALVEPDAYGRPVTVPLGTTRLFGPTQVVRQVRFAQEHALLRRHVRLYHLRLPASLTYAESLTLEARADTVPSSRGGNRYPIGRMRVSGVGADRFTRLRPGRTGLYPTQSTWAWLYPARTDLSSRTLTIKVTAPKHRRLRVSGFRVTVDLYRWSTTPG
jgi:hypothetical protein